jgi:hypothetical protein
MLGTGRYKHWHHSGKSYDGLEPRLERRGGIPNRTTVYKTLSPLGGTKDDTAQIQAALDGCPANQVVQLTAGTFSITGNGLNFLSPNCTLRGVGPGTGASGGNLADDTKSVLVGVEPARFLSRPIAKPIRASRSSISVMTRPSFPIPLISQLTRSREPTL